MNSKIKEVSVILLIVLLLVISVFLIVKNYRDTKRNTYLSLIENAKETVKIVVSYNDDILSCGFCEYKEKRIITDELEIIDVIKILNRSKLEEGNEDSIKISEKGYKFEMYNKNEKLLLEFTIEPITIKREEQTYLGKLKEEEYEVLRNIAEKIETL